MHRWKCETVLLVIDNIYRIIKYNTFTIIWRNLNHVLRQINSPFFAVLGFPANRTTLDSGMNVAPGITVDPSLINFNTFLHQSRHCGHFCHFYFFQNFSKINKRSPMFVPESRVL